MQRVWCIWELGKNTLKNRITTWRVTEERKGRRRGEFGLSAIIGIAIGLIIAAFVLLPGIRGFATTIITDMESWWRNTMSNQVFSN